MKVKYPRLPLSMTCPWPRSSLKQTYRVDARKLDPIGACLSSSPKSKLLPPCFVHAGCVWLLLLGTKGLHNLVLRPNMTGVPEIELCRIRMFVWSFGARTALPSPPFARPTRESHLRAVGASNNTALSYGCFYKAGPFGGYPCNNSPTMLGLYLWPLICWKHPTFRCNSI